MPRKSSAAPDQLRCAIYTRKSHEEGLEQDFNSLDAQREACEAYVFSQKHEGWSALSESLIVRIDLNPKTVDIQLRPNAIAYLKLDDFQPCPDIEGPTKSLSIPARLKRAGMEKRMIVDGPSTSGKKRKPDRSLIRLILTGQRYQDRIVKAEGKSIQQLCDEEGVTRSYFTRALRLAYLAPDMIKLILAGSQPADMKASTLKRASRLPLDWAEQRSLFGIS